MSNVTTRLKRLEQMGIYPLRIVGIYNAMCDLDAAEEGDFVAKTPAEDLLAVARCMYADEMTDFGVEEVRARMRESGRFDEQRVQWLTAGLPISADDTGVEARRGATAQGSKWE